jgi:hypothetical protein
MFANQPVKCGVGTDQPFAFTVDPNVSDPGSIIAWTIQFDFMVNYGQTPYLGQTTLFTLTTTGGGVTIQDGLKRQFSANCTKANFTLPAGEYFYQAYRTDSGSADCLGYGICTLGPP